MAACITRSMQSAKFPIMVVILYTRALLQCLQPRPYEEKA